MIVWLNGAFGAGKTTTAAELVPLIPDSRLFDPETVGYMLTPNLADRWPGDFQHWPPWRVLVAATAAELTAYTGQHLIAPQTVTVQPYLDEIYTGLHAAGLDVFHVLLDVREPVLRNRVEASQEAVEWRLDHLAGYQAARPWLLDAADLVVDITQLPPADAARRIADALPPLSPPAAPRGLRRYTRGCLLSRPAPALRLRPLRPGDEAAFREAQLMMAAEDFTFGLGFEPDTEWVTYLKILEEHRRGVNLPDDAVPATFLVADVAGVIVGRSSIRHQLNEFLEREGGHIGYCVLPGRRRRGYATEILRQSLVVIRAIGVDRVLVTCDDDNTGSIAVIGACGGKLASVISATAPGPPKRRYWID